MRGQLQLLLAGTLSLGCGILAVSGHNQNSNQRPQERIYEPNEVETQAKITSTPQPPCTLQAEQNAVVGYVLLWVVLRSDGKIGEIRRGSPLPFGLTEVSMKAAKKIKFVPAVADGKNVSERIGVKYYFDCGS